MARDENLISCTITLERCVRQNLFPNRRKYLFSILLRIIRKLHIKFMLSLIPIQSLRNGLLQLRNLLSVYFTMQLVFHTQISRHNKYIISLQLNSIPCGIKSNSFHIGVYTRNFNFFFGFWVQQITSLAPNFDGRQNIKFFQYKWNQN